MEQNKRYTNNNDNNRDNGQSTTTTTRTLSSKQIERELEKLFEELQIGFKNDKILRSTDANKATLFLKQLTNKMGDCKRAIKEYERLRREELLLILNNNNNNSNNNTNMNTTTKTTKDNEEEEINRKKKQMVQELNRFVTMKKSAQNAIAEKQAAIAETTRVSSSSVAKVSRLAGVLPTFEKVHEIKESDDLREMDSQQLVYHGRGLMNQTDKSVSRSKKIVHETIEIGAATAGRLKDQTRQLDEITDELDELHFSIKKSLMIVRDITKGLATDRCVITLMLLVSIGVVAVIVVKATGADKKKDSAAPGPPSPAQAARRFLLMSVGDYMSS
jgi:novel plant SNARE